ncbi:hypothetical protein [Lignipirellula cremea]|uniref:hypothetical protein n=1 Tax=Lignipirellula cremea TaxID=2528010 RepID=UPI0011A5CEEA|nr:hypothetical protein [Lignipirellula cremea]
MSILKKYPNPFYILLMVVGTIFAVTACAYGMMSVHYAQATGRSAVEAAELLERTDGWMAVLHHHGVTILVGQLVVLGVLTAAAMATDPYWRD